MAWRYGRGVPDTAPELDLKAIEHDLRSRLAETQERIAELTKPPEAGADIGFGKRIGDGTNEAVSRFTEIGVANDLHAIEERIERALEKLEDGTYGRVTRAEETSRGPPRAAPESALCTRCAQGGS